jgi:hypothetical protein
MALEVHTFVVDPYKPFLRRDTFDAVHAPARFDIRIVTAADLTGVVITIQSPVPGAAAITVTAGVDFPNTTTTRLEMARAVLSAIETACDGLLRLHDSVDPDYLLVAGTGEPGQALFAPRPGAWGEAITLEVNAHANAANIEVNGVTGPAGHTENAIGGSGPAGTQALEDLVATLNAPGGGAPEFVSLSQVTLASGEIQYTLVLDAV